MLQPRSYVVVTNVYFEVSGGLFMIWWGKGRRGGGGRKEEGKRGGGGRKVDRWGNVCQIIIFFLYFLKLIEFP